VIIIALAAIESLGLDHRETLGACAAKILERIGQPDTRGPRVEPDELTCRWPIRHVVTPLAAWLHDCDEVDGAAATQRHSPRP
jgi:hypothetical protein